MQGEVEPSDPTAGPALETLSGVDASPRALFWWDEGKTTEREPVESAKQGLALQLLATGLLLSAALVTLLGDGELDTTAAGHGDHGLAVGADDEDVGETGGEVTAKDIADVDDVEATEVTLLAGDDTGTTHVATTSDHDGGASVEGDKVKDLLGLDVESDSVVDLDGRVGVSDGAAVVGDDVGDAASAELHLLHLEELVGGLLGGDAVDDEAALGIVEDAEVLARLLDRDDVLETGGVGGVSADLAVDLDEALGSDGVDLATGEGVLQAVAEEDLRGGKRVGMSVSGNGMEMNRRLEN